MKPSEIENLVKRMVGNKNYKGLEADRLERRFGTTKNSSFNCTDRADICRRIAEKEGYKAEFKRQRLKDGTGHRYLEITDKNGNVHEVLKS